MKKLSFLIITFFSAPVFSSPYCINNSENLKKPYDSKEWHSVECYCRCPKIKNGFCPVCGHLQKAHPLTIVEPNQTSTTNMQQAKKQRIQTLQDFINNRVKPYLQNR